MFLEYHVLESSNFFPCCCQKNKPYADPTLLLEKFQMKNTSCQLPQPSTCTYDLTLSNYSLLQFNINKQTLI